MSRMTKAELVARNEEQSKEIELLKLRLEVCRVTFQLIRKQMMFLITLMPKEEDSGPDPGSV